MKNKLVNFVGRLLLVVKRYDEAAAMGERIRKRVLEKLAAQQSVQRTLRHKAAEKIKLSGSRR